MFGVRNTIVMQSHLGFQFQAGYETTFSVKLSVGDVSLVILQSNFALSSLIQELEQCLRQINFMIR